MTLDFETFEPMKNDAITRLFGIFLANASSNQKVAEGGFEPFYKTPKNGVVDRRS